MINTRTASFVRIALVIVAASLAFVACVAEPAPDDDGTAPTYQGAQPEDPPPVGEDAGSSNVEDTRCPAVGGIAYERPRPNVMLLVDRSGSMAEPGACSEATCPSKWEQLRALGDYLADIKTQARLGLSFFPSSEDGSGCSVASGVVVPLSDAPDVDQSILGSVALTSPGGGTPIAAALDELEQNGGLDDPDRDNIVVLLTDGMPNCACEGDMECERAAAITAVGGLVERDVPVRLHVVGFGGSATAASDTLTAMAVAAGTALPGPTYYQADTVEGLVQRLYQIAAGVAPCRFTLDTAPPSDSLLVWLDDALVAPCTTGGCDSGYTYDEAAGVVELHGTSCAAIRDGQCHNVWFDTTPSE